MMEMILDYATVVAFIALTIDILFQITRIIKRKSSRDISINGCIIRLIAVFVLQIKFVILDDSWLIFGQALFNIFYLAYFILVIKYRK